MALRRIVDAASEPVTVQEAKDALDYARDDRDLYIVGLIKGARHSAEQELGRTIGTQEWEKTLDAFPRRLRRTGIRLGYPPLQSVQSIQYREATAGALTTLSAGSYAVDAKSEPGSVQPAYLFDWPETWPEINAVNIRFICGETDVPQGIKNWIIAMVGHYLENKEASTPDKLVALPFLSGLLDPFTIDTF